MRVEPLIYTIDKAEGLFPETYNITFQKGSSRSKFSFEVMGDLVVEAYILNSYKDNMYYFRKIRPLKINVINGLSETTKFKGIEERIFDLANSINGKNNYFATTLAKNSE